MTKIDVMSHQLVPKHEILLENEVDTVLKNLDLKKDQLPKILITDPVVKRIGAKVGDVVKILRESQTCGVAEFYRIVIEII